jgi:hypothetical protein
VIWDFVSEFLGFDIGASYISVASKWLLKDKFYIVNVNLNCSVEGIMVDKK